MQISESVIRPGFHADLHNCWAYTKAMFANNLGVIKKRKFFKDKMISFMNILKRFNFFLVLTQLLASLQAFEANLYRQQKQKEKKIFWSQEIGLPSERQRGEAKHVLEIAIPNSNKRMLTLLFRKWQSNLNYRFNIAWMLMMKVKLKSPSFSCVIFPENY